MTQSLHNYINPQAPTSVLISLDYREMSMSNQFSMNLLIALVSDFILLHKHMAKSLSIQALTWEINRSLQTNHPWAKAHRNKYGHDTTRTRLRQNAEKHLTLASEWGSQYYVHSGKHPSKRYTRTKWPDLMFRQFSFLCHQTWNCDFLRSAAKHGKHHFWQAVILKKHHVTYWRKEAEPHFQAVKQHHFGLETSTSH